MSPIFWRSHVRGCDCDRSRVQVLADMTASAYSLPPVHGAECAGLKGKCVAKYELKSFIGEGLHRNQCN